MQDLKGLTQTWGYPFFFLVVLDSDMWTWDYVVVNHSVLSCDTALLRSVALSRTFTTRSLGPCRDVDKNNSDIPQNRVGITMVVSSELTRLI